MRVLKTSIFLSVISILIVKAFSQEEEETQDLIVKNSESKTEKNIVGPSASEPITINQPVKLPEIVVVNPIRRIGTANSQANISPCGGIDKNKADTLTNMGSLINAIWEIRTPVANGNCTVSMSTGLDVNFTALKPISDFISYDEDYSFPCGRQAGFEFQQFELPKDYACDQCTLQVKWETPVGEYYTCSDIMILGNKMEDCMAKCLNGGACVNGKCICTKNFGGDFCENDLTEKSNAGWWILIILFLAALGVGGYLLFIKNKNQSWTNEKKDQTLEGNFIEKNQKPIEVE